MVVQIGVVQEGGARRIVANAVGFGDAPMPLLCGEIALADAHQGVEFRARGSLERGDRVMQSLQGLRVRRQRVEAERSGRIVLAARGFYPAQVLFGDVAEKVVAFRAGRLGEQRYEMRLILVQCAQHLHASCRLVREPPFVDRPRRAAGGNSAAAHPVIKKIAPQLLCRLQ